VLGERSRLGVLTKEVSENGYLIFAILYYMYAFAQSRYQKTSFWTWRTSNFCEKETGDIKWVNVGCGLLYIFINFVSGFLVLF
jgi:hypothetical protein